MGRNDVKVESRRVKPKPSLHQIGIHGRENREAVGVDLHPFAFRYQGLDVLIPNPVSLSTMKMTAMRDQWLISRGMAEKHRRMSAA